MTSVTVMSDSLKHTLTSAAAITPGKTALPILQGIRLSYDTGCLTAQSTDLEFFYEGINAAHALTAVDFDTVITAASAKALCAALPKDESVTLEIQDGSLRATAYRLDWSCPTLDPNDCPVFPDRQWQRISFVTASILANALKWVTPAAHKDEHTRPYLHQIHIAADYDTLTLTTTDGFRMHQRTIDAGAKEPGSVLIPSRAVPHIARMLKRMKDRTVGILASRDPNIVSCVLIEGDNEFLTLRYPDVRTPDWEQIKRPASDTRLTVYASDLASAAKSLKATAKDHNDRVILEHNGNGTLRLMVKQGETIHASATVPVIAHTAQPVPIAANCQYLIDAASDAAHTLTIDILEPNKSIVMSTPDATALVMPMVIGPC